MPQEVTPMEQQEFTKHLHTLRNMIINGVVYFTAWYTIANLNEDEAHALNRYRGFFTLVRSSLADMALLQFAKIFDYDTRTVSIRTLLSDVKSNATALIPYAEEGDIEKLESKIEEDAKLLDNLKTYRDQHLAHQDRVMEDISLPFGEVKKLVDDTKGIYDLLSTWHERSTTAYDFLSREVEEATSGVKRIMCEDRERTLSKYKQPEANKKKSL